MQFESTDPEEVTKGEARRQKAPEATTRRLEWGDIERLSIGTIYVLRKKSSGWL